MLSAILVCSVTCSLSIGFSGQRYCSYCVCTHGDSGVPCHCCFTHVSLFETKSHYYEILYLKINSKQYPQKKKNSKWRDGHVWTKKNSLQSCNSFRAGLHKFFLTPMLEMLLKVGPPGSKTTSLAFVRICPAPAIKPRRTLSVRQTPTSHCRRHSQARSY
jgi:hypothetical protein